MTEQLLAQNWLVVRKCIRGAKLRQSFAYSYSRFEKK
jgi:hypothetical protein